VNHILEQLAEPSVRPHFELLLSLALRSGVTDVLANGPGQFWVDSGKGLELQEAPIISERQFDHLARLIVALGDRHLDQVAPIADVSIGAAQLPLLCQHGVSRLRVHAALASAVSDQTLLSVRVHRIQGFGLAELASRGMFSQGQGVELQKIIDRRANFLVCGPAGSGKSTLLRAMLAETPGLRTVVVEDSAEIVPVAGHVVGLQVRQANVEGEGAITLENLAREALRMRPDRIVVGEVRGAEASVLLSAMTTGHRGSAATLHANSVAAVRPRLTSLAATSGVGADSFDRLFDEAIDAIIQLVEGRRVAEIQWLERAG